MQKHDEKDHGQQAAIEDDEVICSNELLAAIRERMATIRKLPKDKQPKDLTVQEGE